MRLVLDTNVVVSALFWQGPPNQLLRLAGTREIYLYSSLPLVAELSDVLSRPKFERKLRLHSSPSISLSTSMQSWSLWYGP